MTNSQAKSELMQIYMSLSEGKKQALDMAFKAMEQADGEYISRQAVMDCYKKWQPYMATRLHEFEKELSELPSVAIPSAYKGMTNGEVITKILKDAEWAELSSDIGLAQEDTIYIKVGGYWWNSPYEPQESEVNNG